jgi:hypothetical protein
MGPDSDDPREDELAIAMARFNARKSAQSSETKTAEVAVSAPNAVGPNPFAHRLKSPTTEALDGRVSVDFGGLRDKQDLETRLGLMLGMLQMQQDGLRQALCAQLDSQKQELEGLRAELASKQEPEQLKSHPEQMQPHDEFERVRQAEAEIATLRAEVERLQHAMNMANADDGDVDHIKGGPFWSLNAMGAPLP